MIEYNRYHSNKLYTCTESPWVTSDPMYGVSWLWCHLPYVVVWRYMRKTVLVLHWLYIGLCNIYSHLCCFGGTSCLLLWLPSARQTREGLFRWVPTYIKNQVASHCNNRSLKFFSPNHQYISYFFLFKLAVINIQVFKLLWWNSVNHPFVTSFSFHSQNTDLRAEIKSYRYLSSEWLF